MYQECNNGVCSGKCNSPELISGISPDSGYKISVPSSHTVFDMQPAMCIDTPIRIEGRPPLIHMQDHSITLYNSSSKLFASLNTTDNKTTIMAYTRRVGVQLDELQEVLSITANAEGDIKVPWVCPWPYSITDWSRKHIRVDSVENASFWCVVKGDLLPVPVFYIEME